MSFITRFALDNTRLTIVFIATVLLIGLSQFFHFPRQEDPPITIREVVVVALYPGMKPADVEELITIPGTEQTVALKDLLEVERAYIDPAKERIGGIC